MEVVSVDDNFNCIMGFEPSLDNSHIIFRGKNNILICEENVKIVNSMIQFFGDNSIIYLAPPTHYYTLNVDIFHNCVLYIDENIIMNRHLSLSLSEEKNIIIGRDCLFSFGIWMRLSNPHMIYSALDKQRISITDSILIGDHVWIGQDAFIMKGTTVGSGSIIAGRSVVSNKTIPSNTLWGGNPAKKIKDDVFFDKFTSNILTNKTAEKYQTFESDEWIYKNEGEILDLKEIDEKLSSTTDLDEKVEFILSIRNNKSHNRFYIE